MLTLFKAMISEVFRPRWAAILGAQGWAETWLDHVRGPERGHVRTRRPTQLRV